LHNCMLLSHLFLPRENYTTISLTPIFRAGTPVGQCAHTVSNEIFTPVGRNLQVILAHEIGHVVLHKKEAQMSAFHELELFDNVDQKEYEANIFASELLLSNEDVMDAINEDQFFFDAARQLCVPPEMLDFKFRIMKKTGL